MKYEKAFKDEVLIHVQLNGIEQTYIKYKDKIQKATIDRWVYPEKNKAFLDKARNYYQNNKTMPEFRERIKKNSVNQQKKPAYTIYQKQYQLTHKEVISQNAKQYLENKKQSKQNINNVVQDQYTKAIKIISSFLKDNNITYTSDNNFDFIIQYKNTNIKILHIPNDRYTGVNNIKNNPNLRVIHLFSDEILLKTKITFNRLKNILGLIHYKIPGRKCIIKEIDSPTKNKFLEKYHIQGKDNSSIRLGAFYKSRLVAVMTFGAYRISNGLQPTKDNFELVRFCSINNFLIHGIANKLLSYFENKYNYNELISYADRRWSNGNLYLKLNFILSHYSNPNYWYSKDGITRLHRFRFRKNILSTVIKNFNPELSETQNMINNNYLRFYDCGAIIFKKNKI